MSYEIEDIAKPIFDAFIKNNASPELMEKVFFDIKNPELFEFLPIVLKNDPRFLKESFKKNLITTESLPDNLKNQEFISREMYLSNLEKYHTEIINNIYPQDEEIVLTAIKSNAVTFDYIDQEFQNNKELMFKCLQENTEVLRFMKKEMKEYLLNNEDLVKELLKTKPNIFHNIAEEKKNNPEILKAVLTTDKGYDIAKDYLKQTKDPEVALMALKIYNGARKNIHQMYGTILKKNKVSENCYNFLKIYLDQKQLDSELPKKDESAKSSRAKI